MLRRTSTVLQLMPRSLVTALIGSSLVVSGCSQAPPDLTSAGETKPATTASKPKPPANTAAAVKPGAPQLQTQSQPTKPDAATELASAKPSTDSSPKPNMFGFTPPQSAETSKPAAEKPITVRNPFDIPQPVVNTPATKSPAASEAIQVAAAPRSERASESKPASSSSAPAQFASAKVTGSTKDWPYFRGPTGMGTSTATGLPITWSLDENIAWKTELPGAGASSPVTFGDRIYLTSYTGYFVPGNEEGSLDDLKRHLIALNRADGSIVWDKPVAAKLPEESKIRDHGFAANTPAVDDERIYVFFGKTGVFAFDHSGTQLWQADVGEKTNGWGTSASPVLYKDLVFINASVESESLVALDRKTGKEKWRAGGVREAWNTPVVVTAKSGREELIVATQGKILAFNPETGAPLWSCKTDIGWYMVPSVVAHEGIIYALGGRSGVVGLAVRAGGDGDVTESHRLWTSTKGSNVSSPIYLDGHVYWANEQGIAFCAKADSGDVVYQQRLERAGQIYASALLADGKLYYVSRDGRTFVIAAKPEFEQLALNELRDRTVFNSGPVVDGSRLLIRSDKYLYCIGK
jgi:outer membrane protein assembly factor BamB